ncbi:4-hydroxy-tetrahydrodipicolinate synthase [Thermococcus thioreducens]|uniref:4-hydroxy-tetrahydrodipicolinate synthase n=1 Tax=Thermococcus thioreducens TaxID=277988 RepID=A0A0Q2M2J4_9EURY|nr:4-hydroxy-tetrahydrodipicolinate synthase [Thermococcus thioreducens]ASJ12787.1 dihydrodipicolinate synthase family protein [Thermococcus thioreducens]KQH82257.1 dihidrodipicolinate synthase [Thermococcus thioreducens]SEV85233.1 4-hydroxy-tetrahydrodipicolinate synthase [Thermococcus thioreducens]
MLRGVFVPHVTPFDEREDVNGEALRELVHRFEDAGLSGLVTLGSNGEFPYLSFEEKLEVVGIVREESSLPVIAGATENSTRETIRLGKALLDLGADALLIGPPYYFKPSQEELFAHYSTLADKLDGEVLIYNVPRFTGVNVPLDIIERLAGEHSNIIGIKDSSANMGRITELLRRMGDEFTVLAGTADVMYPSWVIGAHGAVVAVANVVPELCAELYGAFKEDDHRRARELQLKINLVNEVVVKRYNQISAIKAAMGMRGLKVGKPRFPSLPLGEDALGDIKEALKTAGVL